MSRVVYGVLWILTLHKKNEDVNPSCSCYTIHTRHDIRWKRLHSLSCVHFSCCALHATSVTINNYNYCVYNNYPLHTTCHTPHSVETGPDVHIYLPSTIIRKINTNVICEYPFLLPPSSSNHTTQENYNKSKSNDIKLPLK